MAQDFVEQYLEETAQIARQLDRKEIEKLADLLAQTREQGGRLFILGVGGGAGHASHAVGDFRKIANMEAYAPTDNVSELTARTNDEGWATVFESWLKESKLNNKDMLLVFSVGGGDAEKNISPNLVKALEFGKSVGCRIGGVVGPKGGFTAQAAGACVKIPEIASERITPHSEGFQAIIWHLLVSHPQLKANPTKWESVLGK